MRYKTLVPEGFGNQVFCIFYCHFSSTKNSSLESWHLLETSLYSTQ